MLQTRKLLFAGFLISLGIVLPVAFHWFSLGGPMFLPMHIPILIGGFLLSPLYAVIVGIFTPLLSSVLTSMPPLFPTALQMVVELAVYGLVISCLYKKVFNSIYTCLIIAMLAGRLANGVAGYVLLTHFLSGAFKLKLFLTTSFVTALPGIIIQLLLIPILVRALEKSNVIQKGSTLTEC